MEMCRPNECTEKANGSYKYAYSLRIPLHVEVHLVDNITEKKTNRYNLEIKRRLWTLSIKVARFK